MQEESKAEKIKRKLCGFAVVIVEMKKKSQEENCGTETQFPADVFTKRW
jgi:hypothetical protein